MDIKFLTGFEGAGAEADGITTQGTFSYSTTTVRSGAQAMRCNPASGVAGSFYSILSLPTNYMHFGLRAATLPSVTRLIFGAIAAGTCNVRLTSAGALAFYVNTTLIGTSTTTLATNTWYWIGIRSVPDAASVTWLQINGANEVTGSATVTASNNLIGPSGTEASALDLFFDDVIANGDAFLASSNVATLLPTADSARSAGWVGGAGGTTNLFAAVDNVPPVGVADTGTNTSQNRNATAEANGSYDATMQTYTVGGASGTVIGVQAVTVTAAPVSTGAKAGTVGVVSNPTIANVALAAGGTAGAFWSGTAGGTFPTGWKFSGGTIANSPSVTLGTAPVMRLTQVTSSTRIAMVCFMGMVVAYTPAAAATRVPYVNPMPQLLAH